MAVVLPDSESNLFAYKHLPLKYTVPYTAGWLGWYAFRALKTGLFATYLKGVGSGVRSLRKLQRKTSILQKLLPI